MIGKRILIALDLLAPEGRGQACLARWRSRSDGGRVVFTELASSIFTYFFMLKNFKTF